VLRQGKQRQWGGIAFKFVQCAEIFASSNVIVFLTVISGGVTPGPPLPPPAPVIISVLADEVISVTEPTYASWNIDSSCNRGFHKTNFSNRNLLAAAKGLAPSKLRFGGSGNDALVYGLTPGISRTVLYDLA
jgi:hypothetical protein